VRAAGDVFRAVEERASSCELAMGVGAPLLLLNLRSEGFSIDGRCVPCRPLWLARGLLEAALDFSGVISARNPAQAGNPYLGSLAEAARSRLALLAEIEGGDLYAERDGELLPSPRSPSGPPISRGTLKRLRFEAAWDGADTGVRARAMALTRRTLIVLGEKNVAFLKPGTGSLIASRRAEGAFLAEGGVLLATGTQCEGLTTDGRPAFLRRPAGWDAPFLTDTAGSCRAGTRGQPATLCIYDGHRVAAVYAATGSTAWQFTAPEAVRVRAASLVRRVFVAADNGFLYALDSVDGRVVFRVRLANALEGLDVDSRSVAVLGRRDGELWLAVVESASGRPRMSRPLAMQAVGRVALLRNRVVVSGILESGSGIVGFSLGGRKTFAHTLASPARGIPAIGLHHRRLLCALRDGSLSCFSDAGRRLWDVSSCGPELEEAVRPCLRRGVLVAGSDPIRAIDPATGALLCELPVLHGLSALAVSPRLDVFAADEDGVVACFRLTTHLSVV
jgi:outer membrane protein assembly factor BamB